MPFSRSMRKIPEIDDLRGWQLFLKDLRNDPASIPLSAIEHIAANSIVANLTNADASPSAFQATVNGHTLRVSGGLLEFGTLDHGVLIGLLDDDHPQYVLRSILTANGDIFTRAAGVIVRLAIGTTAQVLRVNAGLPEWQTVSPVLTLSTDLSGNATFTDLGNATLAATIVNDAVTNAKLADMAQSTIKGRAAGAGTGDPQDLSAAQVATIVNSSIDHDALLNFVANEHIDHTSVTLTAGAGLTGGGDISANRTFDVGAGTGITVNANDVAISTDGVTNTLLADMADSTIKGRASGAGSGDPTDLSAAQVAAIVSSEVASALNITSGTYTPTLTNVTNVAASSTGVFSYSRIGNVVWASGRVTVTPTAAAAATELGISLPVASNFGGNDDAAGTAAATSVVSEVGGIQADAVNDRARLSWITTVNTLHAMRCIFMYQVI